MDAAETTILCSAVAAAGVVLGGVVSGLFKRRPDNTTAEAAFQEALNGATEAYTRATEAMISRQEARLKDQDTFIRELETRLRARDEEVQGMRDAMRRLQSHADDCDAASAQAQQRMESLEAILRKAGFNIPARGVVTELQIATVHTEGQADVTQFSGGSRRLSQKKRARDE